MRAIAVDGQILHTRLDGAWNDETGPVVLFSNSLGTDLRVWDPLLPHLPARWRLLRYDTAGHGLSPDAGPRGIADHAVDAIRLMDACDVEKAIVVGLSVGGQIAQALAAAAPERVSALVLSNTAPRIGSAEMWAERMAALETDGLPAMADAVLERWFSPAFREQEPAALALWRAMLERTPLAGYMGLCAALRDADLTGATARIEAPCLCLGGGADGATPPATVRAMAEAMANARYVEIADVGHLPCVEAPKAFARHLIDFVKETGLG